jgi:TctA family transporter
MIEFIILLLLGLVAGVLIGLLPGIPAYLGPLILLPFANEISMPSIIVFWLVSHIGSQYFGSVSALLLKIPGEVSSLIYINDLSNLSTHQQLNLVRQTAWGSTIASLIALIILTALYCVANASNFIWLTSNDIKISLLLGLSIFLCVYNSRPYWATALFMLGIALSEKTLYDLPHWVFSIQEWTSNISVFSLILGLVIIPEFVNEIRKNHVSDTKLDVSTDTIKSEPLKMADMLRGGAIGSVIGFIPGPSHIFASIVSYRLHKDSGVGNRVVAAEAANNSAIITALAPFFLLGIPITLSEVLLYDLMQIKLWAMPTSMLRPWDFFSNINIIELMLCAIAVSIIAYQFLAQRFLKFYIWAVTVAYKRFWILFLVLCAVLIFIDINYSAVTLMKYTLFLSLSTIVGLWFSHKEIDSLPLVFGFVMGDIFIWSIAQFVSIHFL